MIPFYSQTNGFSVQAVQEQIHNKVLYSGAHLIRTANAWKNVKLSNSANYPNMQII